MGKGFLMKVICAGIVILMTLRWGCVRKKPTSLEEIPIYLIKDYFPLNDGDEWIWEKEVDSIPEPFLDGDINLGEPYWDANNNGVYDFGEEYEDLNSNGKYDGPNDPWAPGVPYIDRNDDGKYDLPNGRWDEGELWLDLDSNGAWDWLQARDTIRLRGRVIEDAYISDEGSAVSILYLTSVGGGGDFVIRYNQNDFSNDSLGLRWHSHTTGWIFDPEDDLKDHGPITIAKAGIQVGDSVINADTCDTLDIYVWISVFEGVENITVPAGDFRDCLKFRSVASGWTGNMERYNGTSYQWYAKNVGLVQSEGPRQDEYWLLKSAKINGKSYP